jgi:hypothetical protein
MKKLIVATLMILLAAPVFGEELCIDNKICLEVPEEKIQIIKSASKALDTATPFLKYYTFDAKYEGVDTLAYVLVDIERKRAISFILTWMGEYNGEPWPYAKYYFYKRNSPNSVHIVLTDISGLQKLIDGYKTMHAVQAKVIPPLL